MRTRPDHREAVARRLELLRAELDPDTAPPTEPDDEEEPWWETAPVLELVPPADEDPEPPVVPVPGRHADRRRWSPLPALGGLVPATLRGRGGLGPWHLTVLALVVAAGLALTCWWLLRSDASVTPVPTGTAAPLVPSLSAASVTTVTTGTTATTAAPTAAQVTVDVAGKVRHPGVVELPAGSRVIDAIEAAGGARPGTDLSGLNRARVLVDGEQIRVGAPAAAATPAAAGASGTTGVAGALVNLNTATAEELDTLPDVGPVTAQAILDYRTEHGGFGSVDELLEVDGIGEVTLAKIAPHVTV